MTGIRAIGLAVLLAGSAGTATRVVQLRHSPPLAPYQAATPRVAVPADAAERRINTALQRLDMAVCRAATEYRYSVKANTTRNGGGTPWTEWQRSVDVPMQGPRFLSLVVTDAMSCGGPHPDSDTWAIVYDLRTGRPVDWTTLLPGTLTGRVTLQAGADGTRTVRLASSRLYGLFMARYGAQPGGPQSEEECRRAVTVPPGSGPPVMTIWLDAKAGGLQVLFPLPHALAPCEEPQLVPTATLRAEGAAAALTDAPAAARR